MKGSSIISGMFVRRFVLAAVFILLAMAGEAGAALESILHEGGHCLICEGADRPVGKTLEIRNPSALMRSYSELRLIRKEQSKPLIPSSRIRSNDFSASRFRVLLI
jgi:hypothetical protein